MAFVAFVIDTDEMLGKFEEMLGKFRIKTRRDEMLGKYIQDQDTTWPDAWQFQDQDTM